MVQGSRETGVARRASPDGTQQARAFAAAIAREHGAELHRFLLRRVANREDVADIVQEVYLQLLHIPDTQLIHNPLGYIRGIATHVVSRFRQRQGHGHVVFDSDVADVAVDREEWRDGVEGGAYFERQASQALAQLPANELAVLLLEQRDGLTQAQIAEKLGLSIHTVKKYSVRALAHVRASLER